MDEEKSLTQTEQYKSQIFFDGDVLTAAEMNNVIHGIDECMERVPTAPDATGQYFLSAINSDQGSEYGWLKNDPFAIYRDPDEDGNVIIGDLPDEFDY